MECTKNELMVFQVQNIKEMWNMRQNLRIALNQYFIVRWIFCK